MCPKISLKWDNFSSYLFPLSIRICNADALSISIYNALI